MFRDLPCLQVDDGGRTVHAVAEEVAVSLEVNGRSLMTAMISPASLEEFVLGFLFTEQIIHSLDEIESIRREKDTFSVLTTHPMRVPGLKKIVLSGCGGTSSFLDARRLPKVTSTLILAPDTIRAAMREAGEVSSQRADGLYRVGLSSGEGPVHLEEDIGRHHAMDKVIGYGVKHRLPLSDCFVVSPQRISSESGRKGLVSGIPILFSNGVTTMAVELAEKNGLCVVESGPGKEMRIYTHHERIRGIPL
jgi:FdhD protein